MTPPTLTRLWHRDELERELRDALDVVEALKPPDDLREALFTTAANALLQRIVEQPRPAIPLGMLGRELGRG